jgi:hypothetical protein
MISVYHQARIIGLYNRHHLELEMFDFAPISHARNESVQSNSTVSKPSRKFLYGARFKNGSLGYIPDPTAMKRARFDFLRNISKDDARDMDTKEGFFSTLEHFQSNHCKNNLLNAKHICNEAGEGLDSGGFEIMKKLKVDLAKATKKSPRILCAIYTHAGNHNLARSAALAWGYKCDGFLAFSTETIPNLGMLDLVHAGNESYANMWQKTRSILAFIYAHYLFDYDYFHLGGDDVFLIVENLKRFLSMAGTKPDDPIFFGQWVEQKKQPAVSGGPGYTLSRASVKLYIEGAPGCWAYTEASYEDVRLRVL